MKYLVPFPACIELSARGTKVCLRQMYLSDLGEVSKSFVFFFPFWFIMTHKAESHFFP